MEIKVVLDREAWMPESAHESDGAYDLRTPIDFSLLPGRAVTVNTGVHMLIPAGYAGLLVAKSGLNVKNDITTTGLVDAGYTGAIRIKLYNHGGTTKAFRAGDKISQIMIVPIVKPELVQVELSDLPITERGAGGFGSTGR